MAAVLLERIDELCDAFAAVRNDLADGRTPVRHVIVQIEHHVDLAYELVCSIEIGLVDREHVADLQDARLDRLNVIAHARNQHDHRRVRRPHNIHLGLPDTDGFDKDDIFAERIHRLDRIRCLVGEAAKAAACPHAADENALVERQIIHTDAVAQDGSAGKGACGVDGNDADGLSALSVLLGKLVRHGALAGTGRTRDAKDVGMSGMRIERLHDVGGIRPLVLDRRDGARESEAIAFQHLGCNIHTPTSFAL